MISTRPWVRRTLTALALTVVALFTVVPVANAATPQTAPAVAVSVAPTVATAGAPTATGACSTVSADFASTSSSNRVPILPVDRWKDSTTKFHSKLGSMAWEDLQEKAQRYGLVSSMMGLGNFGWSLGSSMATSASQFCLLDTTGSVADKVAASFGNMVLGKNPAVGVAGAAVGAMVIVLALVGVLWQHRNRGGTLKALLVKLLIFGFVAIMAAGATNSTGDSATGTYQPGTGSPGWFAVSIDRGVTSFASIPAAAMTALTDGMNASGDFQLPRNNQTSCKLMTTNMLDAYRSNYGTGTSQMASAVPLMLNNMWMQQGLEAWKKSQFGEPNATGNQADGFNDLVDRTWCPLLEYFSSQPVTLPGDYDGTMPNYNSGSRRALMLSSTGQTAGLTNALVNGGLWETKPFFPTKGNDGRDRTLVAAAACVLTGENVGDASSWRIANTWQNFSKDSRVPKTQDCADWWTKTDTEDYPQSFDWPASKDDIVTDTSLGGGNVNYAARAFLLNLHGNDNAAGLVNSFAYAASGVVNGTIFAMVGLVVYVVKVIILLLVAFMILVLLAAATPFVSSDKAKTIFSTLIGLTVFSVFAFLIYGVIGMSTQWLSSAGNSLFAPGSFGALVWAAISPLIAVLSLHFLFKRVFKLPSPFSFKGLSSWATMAAGAGGAALGGAMGAGIASRVTGTAKRGLSRAGRGAASNLMHKRNGPSQPRPGSQRNHGGKGSGAGGASSGASREGRQTAVNEGSTAEDAAEFANTQMDATGRSKANSAEREQVKVDAERADQWMESNVDEEENNAAKKRAEHAKTEARNQYSWRKRFMASSGRTRTGMVVKAGMKAGVAAGGAVVLTALAPAAIPAVAAYAGYKGVRRAQAKRRAGTVAEHRSRMNSWRDAKRAKDKQLEQQRVQEQASAPREPEPRSAPPVPRITSDTDSPTSPPAPRRAATEESSGPRPGGHRAQNGR